MSSPQRLKVSEYKEVLAFLRKYAEKNLYESISKLVSDREWYFKAYEESQRELRLCLQPGMFDREKTIQESMVQFRERERQQHMDRGQRLYDTFCNPEYTERYLKIHGHLDFILALKEANEWARCHNRHPLVFTEDHHAQHKSPSP